MENSDSKVVVKLRGGGSLVSCKPLFSSDSKYLICCSGNAIQVLSVSSGFCISTLRGHHDRVTCVAINPTNRFQIVSTSLDCTVIIWSFEDGVLLEKYSTDSPLLAIFPSLDKYLGITKENALVGFKLEKHNNVIQTKTLMEGANAELSRSSVGCKGSLFATIHSKTLIIYDVAESKTRKFKVNGHHKLTCVECHPTEYCVATGMANGQIVIWRNLLDEKTRPAKIYPEQWHALPVRALSFTSEGSYLLSGGYECTLMKTHLTTLKQNKLPRLGAPIMNIACSNDGSLYAACHIDNGIQVIGNNFKIIQIFQGLVQAHVEQQVKQPMATGLQFDPRTGSLVLNGAPGHLQFFDIRNDNQLFSLDIVGENYISPENLKRPLVLTEVENAAFDERGDWLATLERRDDGESTVNIRLKFWSYSKEKQTFELNTCVNQPHTKKVHTLKFRNSGDTLMVLSSSADGCFKVWDLVNDSNRKNVCWNPGSVGYYRGKSAGPADFSQDGSLIAVGFEEVLTFWDPEDNSLISVHSFRSTNWDLPLSSSTIRHVVFGQHQCDHMLLISTEDKLYGWDVLIDAVSWVLPLRVAAIAAQPSSNEVAVFTREKGLHILKPTSSGSIYKHEAVASSEVMSASFAPVKGPSPWGGIYYITKSQELFTLEFESNETQEEATQMVVEESPQELVGAHLVKKKLVGGQIDDDVGVVSRTKHTEVLKKIINMPVYAMPEWTSLCSSFLSTLLPRHETRQEKESSDDDDDLPQEMEL